jgi:hypothetical protein
LEQAELIQRGFTNNNRVIRTVEKEAITKAVAKIIGAEETFLPRRKRTSTGGGSKLPTDSIDNKKEDSVKGMVSLPFNGDAFKTAWNRYVEHRRQLKRPISKSQVLSLFEQFKKWGEDKSIKSIDKSVASGWVGVFELYIQQNKTLTQNDHQSF